VREKILSLKIETLRSLIQWGFFAWIAFMGIRFGLFVRHFESGGVAPFVSRPAGVDGFLPIGALVSLKHWLAAGVINPLHPAAVVIFLSIIVMSLLAKNRFAPGSVRRDSFRAAGKLGRRLFGRNFRIWRPLDVILPGCRYLSCSSFKDNLVDMPNQALAMFLETPYWAVSDVKMLHFFANVEHDAGYPDSSRPLSVLCRFWCRYLCPWALLRLTSLVSPFKIRRDASLCTGCRSCSAACPARLPVHERKTIRSPECNGCLSCTSACPEKKTLRMALPLKRKNLPTWLFPAVALGLFAAGIGIGMATGYWQSSLDYADYQRLIPLAPFLSH
jgi:ferredoxin